ncbi:MAG: heme ABC transporter ATP-binding protein [Lautropia mirabilis]|uniref:heme ABC transporter ATP-binding protein n=1 Tax=Lautropia mirabilis TaxID=47671 RepID=UPI001CB039EC|nr:heme ABC transporter ATP-binding protein [Lautropia mirabilis]MBF1246571.1 heme ABC transporter ATP-binding protein [Lautropia mirabilis]MBF1258336.1 heme ABC transporter ATP-binding protein [Lautropia mirabilis]
MMLQAHGIAVQRGERQILSDIDLSLPAGQVIGVLGANGAGKSTLLAALAGELSPSAGRITLNGRPLSAWPAAELASCRAVLPQSPSLQFDLPVATVIGMGAYPHARHTRTGAPRTDSRDTAQAAIAEDQRILQRVLALADVQDLYERRYRRLSGGEQQRVHLARVLYQLLLARQGHDEYRVLMLDEPTASLDPRHQLHLLSAVHTLVHEENVAALVIVHDLNLAAGCCDRLLLLGQGRVAACGTPAQVLTPDTLRQVYGVEATVLPHPNQPGRPLVVF